MKILVTGGGGFLGRYIVEQLLARGDAVTVFARGIYPELEQVGATLIRGDISDKSAISQACHGMDAVFHVAAKAGYWGTWESFYRPNVIGTKNIINACKANSVPKLVYTSSPSVVSDGKPKEGIDESYPYPNRNISFYSATKAEAEQMICASNSNNLLTVSLRPRLIWGPRDTQLLPRMIARAKSGLLFQIGDGTNKSDITYVEDAAHAHLLALDALEIGSAVAGQVYFITHDEPVLLWNWLNNFFRQLDIPPVTRKIPYFVAYMLGWIFELVYRSFNLSGKPRITRLLVNALANTHYYDISRAKHDLGYQPQVSMEEGLEKTVDYFRE